MPEFTCLAAKACKIPTPTQGPHLSPGGPIPEPWKPYTPEALHLNAFQRPEEVILQEDPADPLSARLLCKASAMLCGGNPRTPPSGSLAVLLINVFREYLASESLDFRCSSL